MFILYADKNMLKIRKKEPVTSSSVNAYSVQFSFSSDWEELDKTAIFRAGEKAVSVLLDSGHQCRIPWEVLKKPRLQLQVGVCGSKGGEVILPTIYADLGAILEGAYSDEISHPPTPDVYQQILDVLGNKADNLRLNGVELHFLAGDYPLSSVILPAGGEGGTTDHRQLTNRDAADQHPIEAITGLEEVLKSIPRPMTADELRKILTGGI